MSKDKTDRSVQAEIEKLKSARKALGESHKRFHAAVTAAFDLIWEGDVRSNSLHWFGDIDGILGYDIGEFPRTVTGHMENIHPDDLDNLTESIEEALKTGSDFHALYRIKCKDNSYRFWEERGKAIEFEQGKAVKWIGAVADITERYEAERILRESEGKYKGLSDEFNTLLDAIPDNLILLSKGLEIIWANKAFASKYSKDVDELQGKKCHTLCCGISAPCKNCPVIVSFDSGKEESTQVMNSEGRIFDKRAFPIQDENGHVQKVIEIARDITAKIHMEEESKLVQSKLIHANKMTSLGTLVSGVAHEINNPNSFILNNTQVLTEIWNDAIKLLDDQYRRDNTLSLANIPFRELKKIVPNLLSGVSDGSLRIKNIVDNLRNFARPGQDCLDGELNINTVIMTSTSILENQIRKRTDNYKVNCDEAVPAIRGSTQQMEQVLINLILNALQSLGDKKDGVRVTTSYNKKRNHVEIKVKDEGRGIPRDVLDHVTEPFYSTKTDEGGTGLGLSISYAIVRDHKGSLTIKSREGKGTTAVVTLPVPAKNV